jgi:hypothetical protein
MTPGGVVPVEWLLDEEVFAPIPAVVTVVDSGAFAVITIQSFSGANGNDV